MCSVNTFWSWDYVKYCYMLNVPPKFLCWNLTLNVVVLEGGCLGHETGAFLHGISALIKKKNVPRNWPKRREVVLLNQAHSLEGCIWSSEGEWGLRALSPLLLCKDSARRQLSMKQEAGLTRHPICWHLDLGLLSLKLWEINFCYL